MQRGTVIKAYGGYYYVRAGEKIHTCTVRGRVKARGPVWAGDQVDLELLPDDTGVIVDVAPRRCVLVRPPVANVDQMVIVTSFCQPAPAPHLVNRLLLQAEAQALAAVVVVNKADLSGLQERQTPWMESLRPAGYPVFVTSTLTGEGLSALAQVLAGRLSVFAGPSGAGKSSLLRYFLPDEEKEAVRSGEISRKLKRGRHTTRHTELFHLAGGGWALDAPGFSRLCLPSVSRHTLAALFPEMRPFLGRCRFVGCLHDKEPDCAVKNAVLNNAVAALRYEEYLTFLRELSVLERRSPQ